MWGIPNEATILETQRCEDQDSMEGKKLSCQCQGSCSPVQGQCRRIPCGQKGELLVLKDELSFGCSPALSRAKPLLPQVSLAVGSEPGPLSCLECHRRILEHNTGLVLSWKRGSLMEHSSEMGWDGPLYPWSLTQGFKFRGAGSSPLPTLARRNPSNSSPTALDQGCVCLSELLQVFFKHSAPCK